MYDLISRTAAMDCCFKPQVRPNAEIFNALKMAISSEISALPSVPAVPLDKLCEWLARFGCPCDINDGMCDMSHGVDRCLGIFNSSSFCWKYLLTKWMEGLDDAEIMVQKT